MDLSQVRLTELVKNPGCASKISPADLERVLAQLPEVRDPAVVSGLAAADDAAIYRIREDLCLVQTVDVFTPCVDDPHLFGRICAANCLSDIYAMGGEPRTALSILAFPSETLDGEIMRRMLTGAMETLGEAGVALVGGHSIKDEEIKLGFAVTGTIDPAIAASLERAHPGDQLVLTKPLGTGVLAFCEQVGRPQPTGRKAAAESMAALNRDAAAAMREAGASACTDVTGFGLFGHLLRLARQSGSGAHVFADALPAFEGALAALREGVVSGAIERNREFVSAALEVGPGVEPAAVYLSCDPQTSGGLLIAIAPQRLGSLREALTRRRLPCYVVGEVTAGPESRIELCNSPAGAKTMPGMTDTAASSRDKPMAMHEKSSSAGAHNAECCADVFGKEGGTAAEAQKAFGGMMRAVQAPGVLDARTKELLLLSLVIYSRCRACFEAHYGKARELGITDAQIEEAAWCAIAMGGAPVRMFFQECLAHVRARASAPQK